MNTYLAVVLGLFGLTTLSVAAVAVPARFPQMNQETQPPDATSAPAQGSPQTMAPPDPPTSKAPPPTQDSPKPASEAPAKKTEAKPASPGKASTKKRRRKNPHPAPADPTPDDSDKKVIKNGGTGDPVLQLSPGATPVQTSNPEKNTSELLAATDSNLKQISSRQLNSTQQDSIGQIRKYMEQAQTAEKTGDLQRAHTLASKALLLSDDLVKH
jgi:hypothetical protein